MVERISTAVCNHCGEKIAGTDAQQCYHIYKVHGVDALRQSLYKGFESEGICMTQVLVFLLGGKENAFEYVMDRMHEIDREENKLT